MPPFVVYFGRSLIALTNPSAAVASRGSSWPATMAPDHPPTPERMEMYCLWSGPTKVTGWPMIPEPVLNCHSGWPVVALTALNQPAALVIESFRDCVVCEGSDGERFARGAVEDINMSVALRAQQHFARLSVDRQIDEDLLVDAVVVELIMRGPLEKPDRLSRIRF